VQMSHYWGTGITAIVLLSLVIGVLLGRFVRPWLVGGLVAAPLAAILWQLIVTYLDGRPDAFILIALFVGTAYAFLVTIPASAIGALWRRRVTKS
jgi:hypothetical protein